MTRAIVAEVLPDYATIQTLNHRRALEMHDRPGPDGQMRYTPHCAGCHWHMTGCRTDIAATAAFTGHVCASSRWSR